MPRETWGPPQTVGSVGLQALRPRTSGFPWEQDWGRGS